MLVRVLVTAAALDLCGMPASRADEPPAPAPSRPTDAPRPLPPGIVEMAFDKQTPIAEVLRDLGKATGRPITWGASDQMILNGKIASSGATLRATPDRLFDAVSAMLAQEGIVLVAYGPAENRMLRAMWAIYLNQSGFKVQPELIEVTEAMLPALLGQFGRYVTTTIPMVHTRNLADVRNALGRFVTGGNVGSVLELPAAGAFAVTDFAPNVATIYRTIRQMDVAPSEAPVAAASAGKKAVPAFFLLKHARSNRVAALLAQLFAAAATPAPSPASTAPPGTALAPASVPPRIGFDETTNQVVVIANADDTATMREIVDHVDVDPNR